MSKQPLYIRRHPDPDEHGHYDLGVYLGPDLVASISPPATTLLDDPWLLTCFDRRALGLPKSSAPFGGSSFDYLWILIESHYERKVMADAS